MTKLPVTVVIPTRNEERNLRACLARLDCFAAVWVVDSGSSDATVAIARQWGVRVLDFRWTGGFPKKRNWVLMNERFETPWVLFLDADEHVTDAFVEEARQALGRTDEFAGFWINYETYFMGCLLSHGISQRKLALFRPQSGLYERIEDPGWSHLDMEVHEHPVLDGRIGEIGARIDHRDFRGIDHYIARHDAYASWEANRYFALVAGAEQKFAAHLTDRQKTKYRHLAKWWFAPAYFIMTYIVKRGFLDGAAGFHHALLKMIYFYQIRLKIREKLAASTRDGGIIVA